MSLRQAAQQALVDMACMRDMVAHPDNLQFMDNAITALRTALAEPEPEPVAWQWKDGTLTNDPDRADGTWTPLYAHPPQRKPLTDEEIELLAVKHAPPIDPAFAKDDDFIEFARAVERAHGIGGEK